MIITFYKALECYEAGLEWWCVVYCSFKLFPAYLVYDFIVLKSHSLLLSYDFQRVNLQVLFIVEMFSIVYGFEQLEFNSYFMLE